MSEEERSACAGGVFAQMTTEDTQAGAGRAVAQEAAAAPGEDVARTNPARSVRTSVAGKAAPKATVAATPDTPVRNRGQMARRQVIWWGVYSFLAACTAATVRFFFPRAIFEPRTRFRVGYPSDYGFGVSTRWQAAQRIWVVRDSGGLYVIHARCTHLGCTPDWKESENKFKCPCHGSGFDTEGVNFEGPAPRPLDRMHLELDAEGQIVVDKSKAYGGLTLALAREAWKKEGAYLHV